MPDDRIEDPSGTAMKAALASVDATCRTLLAQTVWLRLVHERATDRATHMAPDSQPTKSVMATPGLMTWDTAMQGEPQCDIGGRPHPRSSCMGCHPEDA